jgi:hypothetical protein
MAQTPRTNAKPEKASNHGFLSQILLMVKLIITKFIMLPVLTDKACFIHLWHCRSGLHINTRSELRELHNMSHLTADIKRTRLEWFALRIRKK